MESTQLRTASPTNVDASLEYITVDKYQWPKSEPPKRSRIDEEERKRRHREGQRQFMSRKRCRIAVLRHDVAREELVLKLATSRAEQMRLEAEKLQLLERLHQEHHSEALPETTKAPRPGKCTGFQGPAESEVMGSPDLENVLFEALLSW